MGQEGVSKIIDEQDKLMLAKRGLEDEINTFQSNVKKSLLEDGFIDALNVNWAMLRRIAHRGRGRER